MNTRRHSSSGSKWCWYPLHTYQCEYAQPLRHFILNTCHQWTSWFGNYSSLSDQLTSWSYVGLGSGSGEEIRETNDVCIWMNMFSEVNYW